MSACLGNETGVYKNTPVLLNRMVTATSEIWETAITSAKSHASATPQTARRISYSGAYKMISFEALTPGLLVRSTDDGHLLALDFLSTLTNGDRKKASQTLARVASRPEMSALLTLRKVACKPKPRKLLSFSNAMQLLLILPKRTVCMDIRRAVAGVLTDHFEYRYQQEKPVERLCQLPQFQFTSEERCVSLRQAKAELTQRELELERQRMRLPLDRLNHCMELMERCGPLSEEEQRKFKLLISDQAAEAVGVQQ